MTTHPDSNRIHYTVDKIRDSNGFIVCVYSENDIESLMAWRVGLNAISKLLLAYSRLGYVADRIAF